MQALLKIQSQIYIGIGGLHMNSAFRWCEHCCGLRHYVCGRAAILIALYSGPYDPESSVVALCYGELRAVKRSPEMRAVCSAFGCKKKENRDEAK